MKAVVTPFHPLFLLLLQLSLLLSLSSAAVVGNDSTISESTITIETNTTVTILIASNASNTSSYLVDNDKNNNDNNTVNPSPVATDNMEDSIFSDNDDNSSQSIPTTEDDATPRGTNHTTLPVEKDPPRNYPMFLIIGFLSIAIVVCGVTLKQMHSKRTHYESIATTELIV